MGALKIAFGTTIAVGLVITAVAGILGWVVLPRSVDNDISEEVNIKTMTWGKWTNSTLPTQLNFYIFHITNSDAVEVNGAFPIFEEKGPYVYNENRTMANNLMEKSGSIFYSHRYIYEFNRSASNGDELDEHDVINVPFLWLIHNANEVVPDAVATFATFLYRSNEKVIKRNVSVRDLLFDGIDVKLYRDNTLFEYLSPKAFGSGLYGLYRERNNSDHGFFQINSGVDSISRLGEVIEWDHKTSLGYWNRTEDTYCDMINGTDGWSFPPFLKRDSILRVFRSDWCRSIELGYDSEKEIMGIPSYRFTTQKELLQDPRINEDNKCFCQQDNLTQCDYSGVLDISSCRGGGPFLLSLPHFLDGDEKYQRDANTTPIRESHQTLIDLEPNSGVLLNSINRLQINIRLRPYNTSTLLANLKEMVFPILWVEETVTTFDPAKIADIENKFLKPIKRTNTVKWTLLGIGLSIAVVGSAMFIFWK